MDVIETPRTASGVTIRPWIRWAAFGLVVVGLVLAYVLLPLKEWLLAIAEELKALGPIAVVAYLASYTVLSLVLFPAALLSIAAGVTWGTVGGAAVAVPATTLAASAAFVIARYFFSGRFRAWLLDKPRLSAVEGAVNDKGSTLVFLLRLSPMLPFPILNYVFGLTRVPFRGFAIATFFGMIPVTTMWAYVGDVGSRLVGAAQDVGDAEIIAGVVGGLITLAVTLWVGKAARRAMREANEARTEGATV